MDTFENNEPIYTDPQTPPAPQPAPNPEPTPQYHPEPEPVRPPQQGDSGAYRGSGSGWRESPYANSPYANSPYEMPHQPQRPQAPNPYEPPADYPKAPKAKKERKPGMGRKVLAALLALALLVSGCGITAALVNNHWEARTASMENQFNQRLSELEGQIAEAGNRAVLPGGTAVLSGDAMTPSQIYAANVNSVVAVSSTVQTQSIYGIQEGTSTGSGFILTENGYIVTNCHVVEGATSVSVITHDGTEYPATIVGSDSTNDVAVLKVEAAGLPAAVIGSSDALTIGDMVVAIGNPLGELTSTQTVGYVSGKDRDVTTEGTIISMIQTDAAINSGNSGGPLFNMYGEVVGITTAKYSGTSGSGASIEGIGFAIPIDDVKGILGDLMEYGYVTGAYMGVVVSNTDAESASMFGLPNGAYVISVDEGGTAHRAGIQPKDIIVELGGHEVTGITTLTRALRNFKAGDTTQVTLIRGGSRITLDITLDEKPNSAAPAESDVPMPSEGSYEEWYEYFHREFGD